MYRDEGSKNFTNNENIYKINYNKDNKITTKQTSYIIILLYKLTFNRYENVIRIRILKAINILHFIKNLA